MKTIYNVYHLYDVDGGFGDAVCQQDLLFTTDSKEIADAFVSKYNNDHIYDVPYAALHTGALRVEEVVVVDNYDDIPQEIIDWGEKNIAETDFREEEYKDYEVDEEESTEDKLNELAALEELQQSYSEECKPRRQKIRRKK